MQPVAKVLIINPAGQYLLLRRSPHPTLPPGDPDIAGGLIDTGEQAVLAAGREVLEETGLVLDTAKLEVSYEGTGFSPYGRMYTLYQYQLDEDAAITLSWEHESYEWLSREEFIEQCLIAADHYVRTVGEFMQPPDSFA